MKKLLLFSAILLGSVGFTSAQTGKKAAAKKVVESPEAKKTRIVQAKKNAEANKSNTTISKATITAAKNK